MNISILNGTITQIQETLTPDSNYALPNSITVTGATSNYNSTSGLLVLTNPTSSVSITAEGRPSIFSTLFIGNKQIESIYTGSLDIARMYIGSVKIYDNGNNVDIMQYTITTDVTNGSYTGATYIKTGQTTATVTLSADSGYDLPSSITVSGASYTYNSTTGVVSLSNFTDNVTITATCAVPIIPYLTFSSPSTFTIATNNNSKTWNGTLEYSTDITNWTTWTGTSAISSSQSGTTKYLYLRGTGNTYMTGGTTSTTGGKSFKLTGSNISCDGNIENLLDYQTVANGQHPTMGAYCYFNMFKNCSSLTTAPTLPATTLAECCYNGMFYGCSSLTTTPTTLPATTLASGCYAGMFRDCTNLTTAPSLPATTLANTCYTTMFYGCTSLTTAPTLPATTLTTGCYNYMFYGCTALTTPAIIAGGTTQASSARQCCYYMYYNCTALNIYTSSSGHTPFYKAITRSTSSSGTNYQSSYRMFYNCKIDGTTSTASYLTAGTQYYY